MENILKLRIINRSNGNIIYDQKEIYRLLYNYNCNPIFCTIGLYIFEQQVIKNGKEIYKEIIPEPSIP